MTKSFKVVTDRDSRLFSDCEDKSQMIGHVVGLILNAFENTENMEININITREIE